MKELFKIFLFNLVVLLIIAASPRNQESEEIVLTLSRDFGYSSGTGRIQGTFSMRVNGPDNLTGVVFLVDGVEIGEDTEAPFRLQFRTSDFSLGAHSLKAVGFTSDGKELHSLEQRREFVSAEEGWKTAAKIAIPVIVLSLAAVLITGVLPAVLGRGRKESVPLGSERNYGVLGGTICPKCNRPFAIHLFGLNLGIGRLDRCPHCGRWSLVRRVPIQELRSAEAHELEKGDSREGLPDMSDEEKLRKELERTRYQDF